MKIVGCEFSKYIQLLENRQRKIRKYREENIKPLLTVIERAEENCIKNEEKEISEEQAQKNCEEMQKLIKQNPKSTISVLRTSIDKCQIREKGTKKIIYEGNTQETLIKLKELLTIEQRNKIEEITKNLLPLELPSVEESKEILRSLGYDI